jgi:chemosensory pili system protein ChpA (sensor histidine kinase/response regulator)
MTPVAGGAAWPAPTLEAQPEPVAEVGPDFEPAPEMASVSHAGAEPRPEPEPRTGAAAPAEAAPAVALPATAIDWARFDHGAAVPTEPALRSGPAEGAGAGGAYVRVRASLLDRLVNAAGEVSITRERIVADAKQLEGSLEELTESLERMRRQLRDIELQAETQIASRMELARAAGEGFDPLEMDRFTRFQELTRFMAESVNDVATLQRSLQRTLQSTEDELAAQARLTRDLQDDLLRTRMVEFESLAERLFRTVRQAAKESGKQVRLDLVGGAIEIDRGVLERMVGSFEHLLRNCVVHGIEGAARRAAAGKDPVGQIQVQATQSGNEVAVEFADDGGGFDFERIRGRAVDRGLLAADARPTEAELAQLLFEPGFSTAEGVTELAGRGVGLDVVRSEVNAMGGRIETASAPGLGTRFRLLLPLTTAVTQVVMLRCGALRVGVPSTLIEGVRRVSEAELGRAYAGGALEHGGESLPFFWLGALLQSGVAAEAAVGSPLVVVVRSAEQRVGVQVDEVLGNQEVVVKNVGPQLARLPGLAGVTLLPSGAVALIYNPVALANVYAVPARKLMHRPATDAGPAAAAQEPLPPRAPLVLVVDDSLTVRRVTQRLLLREGYRVAVAKDGLEALERLAEERPVVLLSDIEMPRMDGFDLMRNVRADRALADLPVVMITSRIAQKHRDYAAELGVNHYLGKPFSEEELLSLVARYAGADIEA